MMARPHSQRIDAFADDDPPISIGANLVQGMLERTPARIAFAGRAGAGKSSVAAVIAGSHPDLQDDPRWTSRMPYPVFNHADGVKCEVLEWVAKAKLRSLIPGERATFVSFCDFLGISPGIVEQDMWEILGEPWNAMDELLENCYEQRIPVQDWADSATMDECGPKVAFVERRKDWFRRSLQAYGESIRQISGNPAWWAEQTVDRGLDFRTCLNADTRYREEADVLRAAGWTVVYLAIDDETQRERRPGFGEEARAHVSENSIAPEDCDMVIDATQPLGRVVMDVAEWLSTRTRSASATTEG